MATSLNFGEMLGWKPDISIAIPSTETRIQKWSISVALYHFHGMYRQLIMALKVEIYFCSIHTVILFQMILYAPYATSFYWASEKFHLIAVILNDNEHRSQVNTSDSQWPVNSAFSNTKSLLSKCLNPMGVVLNDHIKENPTIDKQRERARRVTTWPHFVNKQWVEKSAVQCRRESPFKYNGYKLFSCRYKV